MRGTRFVELTAFAAVADHRNFTRAAARLGISPSTLGKSVRSLENRLANVLTRAFMFLALTALGTSVASGATLTPPENNAETPAAESRPVEKVAIVDQKWVREGGLFIVELTFDNANRFPLVHVIIACDFGKPGSAARTGSRGSLVPRIISPGRTTVGGIEFVMSERDTEGGSCKVLSAQRIWTGGPALADTASPSAADDVGTCDDRQR